MNAILDANRAALADLCRAFGVQRLEVFGSAARSDFDPRQSDVDFIVVFSEAGSHGYADRYLEFAEALERLLKTKVDLLTERSLRNPIFIRGIAADRRILYAA
jgi:uncharacterized protein